MKISPEGMLRLPSELIQVRPATERVKSVPGASIRSDFAPGHEFDQAGLAAPQLLPGGLRVVPIEEHGPGDEIFILGKAHAGGLGVSLGRILGQDPPPMPRGLADRVSCAVECCLPAGIDPAHRARVALGRDPDPRRDLLGLEERLRRQMSKLGLAGLLEEVLVKPGDLEPQERMPPLLHDRLETRFDERLREHARAEHDRLAALDSQAIIDQQVGPACGHQVVQVPFSVDLRRSSSVAS